MKKLIVCLLSLVMVIGMAVPAMATAPKGYKFVVPVDSAYALVDGNADQRIEGPFTKGQVLDVPTGVSGKSYQSRLTFMDSAGKPLAVASTLLAQGKDAKVVKITFDSAFVTSAKPMMILSDDYDVSYTSDVSEMIFLSNGGELMICAKNGAIFEDVCIVPDGYSTLAVGKTATVANSSVEAHGTGLGMKVGQYNFTLEVMSEDSKDTSTPATPAAGDDGKKKLEFVEAAEGVRIYYDAGNTKPTATADLDLAGKNEDLFEKYFKGNYEAVSFTQASWSPATEIAVKTQFTKDVTLYFCTYNKAANTYSRFIPDKYWVDEDGFLHIITTKGGNILFADQKIGEKK